MKDRSMNVRFEEENAVIDFLGKQKVDTKENILFSLEQEIAFKNFIMENEISRQDIGDFIYYQFIYFDGKISRNVKIQVPKKDTNTIHTIDTIRMKLQNEKMIETIDYEDVFDGTKVFYKDIAS